MLHDVRSAYGWTNDTILEHVEQLGVAWLIQTWRYIQEDRIERYQVMAMIAPISRSIQDAKGARWMKDYTNSVDKTLREALPWKGQQRSSKLANLRASGKIKPGEVVVMLEAGESGNNPLFADARTVREKK